MGVHDVVRCAERLALGAGAGLPWPDALRHAGADVLDPQRPVEAAAARGRDGVRAAVALVERLGVASADVLRGAAESVRARAAADARRRAALAGPVASARVVGALPLAGPAAASLVGVDAVGVLTGTAWGRVCAVLGLLLLALSWWWAARLVALASAAGGGTGTGVDDATVCDLAAAALGSGCGTATALRAVADALAGVQPSDARVAELHRLADGTDVGDLRLAVVHGPLEPLRDAVGFSLATGAPAARSLRLAAEEVRREAETEVQAATGRLAARLVLPLGLAALPGFLLLGIAPVVLRLLSDGLA